MLEAYRPEIGQQAETGGGQFPKAYHAKSLLQVLSRHWLV